MGVYLRGNSYYIDFYYEGKRYTEKVGPVRKSVALEKMDVKRSEVIRGEWKPKVVKVSFEKFKEDYLELTKADREPSSVLRDECSLKHLSKAFDNKRLSEINPLTIAGYKKTRLEEGSGPATLNRELACLRTMLFMALSLGKLQRLPFRFGKKRKADAKMLQEPPPRDRTPDPEEEERLLEIVRATRKSEHLEPIIITPLNTGMRKMEILSLKWEDVDFNKRVIKVKKTKNHEPREVPTNEKLTATLERGKKESKGKYIFSEDGGPYRDIKTGWWTALEKAGIKDFHFHDLRHTFGTRLSNTGVGLKNDHGHYGDKGPESCHEVFESNDSQLEGGGQETGFKSQRNSQH